MTTGTWLTTTAAALRTTDTRFPWVHPTDEEDDIAAVLEAIDEQHQPTADQPDHRSRYGPCTGCRQMWPCDEQRRGRDLALLWLGRGADRYAAHAEQAWRTIHPAPAEPDPPQPRPAAPVTPLTETGHDEIYGASRRRNGATRR